MSKKEKKRKIVDRKIEINAKWGRGSACRPGPFLKC